MKVSLMQEQPLVLSKVEMHHSRLQIVWDLLSKTRAKIHFTRNVLLICMHTYNYNLQWDRALRSNTENPENHIQEIDIDDQLIENAEEKVEMHNWITGSENSDLSDPDC
ncbi:hypothetical protein LOD99_4062 [Oopsacas minuta]|uniref:Uncharacterized protein n=1 Tax=Oopsacas minuta TaxID=111878 RepID=A0AAV7JX06_9METZ|nr:hypothetical protein LOD99_4062 [Oopsacas minuta]